ncbi:ERI1 (YPL096C-A) [Zygosaccharomyces parabailii]|nr:ERI1 (YPL096C-A) [Zygosaccharomyces parabailii]
MQQRTAAYCILAGTYGAVALAVSSLLYVRNNSDQAYYLCWLLLCPVMFWLWVVRAWSAFEMFRNIKG